MTEFDKKLKEIIDREIEVPYQFTNKIINFKAKKKNYQHRFFKIATITCMSIIVATGITFATQYVYQKIWKEPNQYIEYEDMIGNVIPSNEITQQDKEEIITEQEARDIAIEFLKKLGYKNESINYVELKRDYSSLKNTHYLVKTKEGYETGLQIHVNSTNGKVIYFNDLELKYKNLVLDNISEKEAQKIALNTYSKLDLANFELKNVEIDKIENQRMNNLWQANFYKKYGEIYNPYEHILISFIVVNQQVIYDTIIISNEEFGDNEVIVSKEEAIEIVKNKEKEFTTAQITGINAEIAIQKSNTLIYQLEHDIYNTDPLNDGTFLDIDTVIRKVWMVTVEHNNRREIQYKENPNQYMKENYSKIYYVDITTGEIIGGQLINENLKIQ